MSTTSASKVDTSSMSINFQNKWEFPRFFFKNIFIFLSEIWLLKSIKMLWTKLFHLLEKFRNWTSFVSLSIDRSTLFFHSEKSKLPNLLIHRNRKVRFLRQFHHDEMFEFWTFSLGYCFISFTNQNVKEKQTFVLRSNFIVSFRFRIEGRRSCDNQYERSVVGNTKNSNELGNKKKQHKWNTEQYSSSR